uniref:Uracil phosphoribosyltransferase n=1 Tax=Nemalion vermiculare TaxID=935621 RepID=UPI00257CB1AA|nr:Uracil phosphoribosyltransferase [Nemalion vermiculare]WGV34384.1 Uracil phosphoribosyltransferase [Nemalion vermiculare]
MPINIYSIKHPLVLHWTSCLSNPSLKTIDSSGLLNKLGLALIYELTRKSLDSNHLYIKYVDYFHDIHLIVNDKICFVCSDLKILQVLGKDITYLIPNIFNYTVPLFLGDGSWHIAPNNQLLPEDISNYNMIVFEEELHNSKISVIISHLLEQNVPFSKIHLCCIICNRNELEKLNVQYPNISIYTCIMNKESAYLQKLR